MGRRQRVDGDGCAAEDQNGWVDGGGLTTMGAPQRIEMDGSTAEG
jgi:hypothetical protein